MQLPWCAFVSLWRLITHSYPLLPINHRTIQDIRDIAPALRCEYNFPFSSSCLNLSNPITFNTIFFMMLLNCFSVWCFEDMERYPNVSIVHDIQRFNSIFIKVILGTSLDLRQCSFLNDERQRTLTNPIMIHGIVHDKSSFLTCFDTNIIQIKAKNTNNPQDKRKRV